MSKDVFNAYWAHSENSNGERHSLAEHLAGVACLAKEFAQALQAGTEARVAALLHDLGKYGELFQRRLEGEAARVDHWSAGAWAALMRFKEKGLAAALAIQGHHLGLQEADKAALREINPEQGDPPLVEGLRYSQRDWQLLLQRLEADGLELPPRLEETCYGWFQAPPAAAMLDLRMFFSVLVDADFLDTEAHFQAGPGGKRLRRPGLTLRPAEALEALLEHIRQLAAGSGDAGEVNRLRGDLLRACLEGAGREPGLFTLSAPTGTGKTLAMLAFALKHAQVHGLRRVVVVIPYLSIIEQSVAAFRRALGGWLKEGELDEYLLEHHSLAGTRGEDEGHEEIEQRRGLLAQNWDAPLVVTTSVQFLESLFAHRPGACRKLHRLAGSVILMDEVQTLPQKLAVPTLATLAHLCRRYGSSLVMATATQPAFDALDRDVKELGGVPWRPREIAPPELGLFSRMRRVRRVEVSWPRQGRLASWDELAAELAGRRQVLCVVNMKRHAVELCRCLENQSGEEGLFHLSTSMCPAHRREVLEEVRRRLAAGPETPCRLISTQCVEAGVDLDFPLVYRALGPLEAIAQAAGRCNRGGRLDLGRVVVFIPPPDQGRLYPDPGYRQAADVCQILLRAAGDQGLAIDDPQGFRRYYQRLYLISQPEMQSPELRDALERHAFPEVAGKYRLIETGGINLLTAYHHDLCLELADEVQQRGLTRDWIRRARPYTVSIFRPRRNDDLWRMLEPVPLPGGRGMAGDWFICSDPGSYHQRWGLSPAQWGEALIN